MKQILKYSAVSIGLSLALAVPALAATLQLPSPPPGSNPSQGITGQKVVDIITQGVNYLVAISTTLAIAYFIYGGIKYAMGDPKAKDILKNAAIGLLAILGVGLVVNTVAGLIARGGALG